jgi:hypothetical protein
MKNRVGSQTDFIIDLIVTGLREKGVAFHSLTEQMESVLAALESGTSKASVCRTFGIPRSTLIDSLARAGWTERK